MVLCGLRIHLSALALEIGGQILSSDSPAGVLLCLEEYQGDAYCRHRKTPHRGSCLVSFGLAARDFWLALDIHALAPRGHGPVAGRADGAYLVRFGHLRCLDGLHWATAFVLGLVFWNSKVV